MLSCQLPGCRVSIVAEQFIRMLHHVGMPPQDADYIHGSGKVVNEILLQARPRNTLFTGSGRIAEKLANDLYGKVRMAPEQAHQNGLEIILYSSVGLFLSTRLYKELSAIIISLSRRLYLLSLTSLLTRAFVCLRSCSANNCTQHCWQRLAAEQCVYSASAIHDT